MTSGIATRSAKTAWTSSRPGSCRFPAPPDTPDYLRAKQPELLRKVLQKSLAILLLFLIHNAINWRWWASILKSKYNARRLIGTLVNVFLLVDAVLLIASDIANSRFLFKWLDVHPNLLDRQFHTLTAYWFLVLMSVHLGLHW